MFVLLSRSIESVVTPQERGKGVAPIGAFRQRARVPLSLLYAIQGERATVTILLLGGLEQGPEKEDKGRTSPLGSIGALC